MKLKISLTVGILFLFVAAHAQIQRAVVRGVETSALARQITRTLALQTRSKIMTAVPPSPKVVFKLFSPSEEQMQTLYGRYQGALQKASALNSQLFAKIYYQTTPEMRSIPPAEINDTLQAITQMRAELTQINQFLDDPDVALETAMQNLDLYAQYFSAVGSGQAVPLAPARTTNGTVFDPAHVEAGAVERPDRVFNLDEFFLQDPYFLQRKPETNFSIPSNLRVAILNDDEDILAKISRINRLHEASGWVVDIYESPEELLERKDCLSYDLILTDLNLRPGGGVYLALRLREMGYKKTILAVSAYDEEPFVAVQLYNNGIDGMFATGYTGALRAPNIHDTLLQKIRNYYYYQQQGNWDR